MQSRSQRSPSRSVPYLLAIVLLLVLAPAARATGPAARQAPGVSGVVRDAQGVPVEGAVVRLVAGEAALTERTGPEGRFQFEAVASPGAVLFVEAPGFAPVRRVLPDDQGLTVDVILAPAPLAEEVTVTAGRREIRLTDTPASVVVLPRAEIELIPAPTIDEVLRHVPGFSLFRRSGSRFANPTAQGVSLRGTGASGAGRAVVLADGLPINDPFGGWVHWGRIPLIAVDRIEVLRGGASDLYGSSAMGGAVQILTERPRASGLALEASAGSLETATAGLLAGLRRGPWGVQVAAEALHTDGYVLVAEEERGPVDTPAGSEHWTVDVLLERDLGREARAFVRGLAYGEERRNGTEIQTNATAIRQLSTGADWATEHAGRFAVRAYGGSQTFHQQFSAIAEDRESERLVRAQRVPAQVVGYSVDWWSAIGDDHLLTAGLDGRHVRGASDEIVFFGPLPGLAVGSGGRERSLGAFARDALRLGDRVVLTAGLRFDWWRNDRSLSVTRSLTGGAPPEVEVHPQRSETALSPHLSALVRIDRRIAFVASGYRAFRAPTLNELYRGFRVGEVVTSANANLLAERLTGGEIGAVAQGVDGRWRTRVVAFWSEITRPIANVTIAITPEVILRERQNLGRLRSRGLEAEAEMRLGPGVVATAGYLFTDATVLAFPAQPEIVGLRVPQVPAHQGTVSVRYLPIERLLLAVHGRFSSSQFDDDRNRFALAGFGLVDTIASFRLAPGVRLFVAAENLFDSRYEIGRTPVLTVGSPAQVRFGARFSLPDR